MHSAVCSGTCDFLRHSALWLGYGLPVTRFLPKIAFLAKLYNCTYNSNMLSSGKQKNWKMPKTMTHKIQAISELSVQYAHVENSLS